ncbi:hypothetical protein NDU88_006336 [Pleurodeles waltl]|uniref:Uncharacterized protein n=1 Tax=Pleurodeles waltl TaxID=8319 RepID=A0AAV7QLG4_PLEWA|nr:hypothetical protein NDU88_006336 [Pleurodeles waltl]
MAVRCRAPVRLAPAENRFCGWEEGPRRFLYAPLRAEEFLVFLTSCARSRLAGLSKMCQRPLGGGGVTGAWLAGGGEGSPAPLQ